MRVAIIPLGVGNLGSLTASLGRLGHQVAVWENGWDVGRADWVILPGVGSLSGIGRYLSEHALTKPLRTLYQSWQPILGICLGMQLWFGLGDEGGSGLGWIAGSIPRLSAQILPHIGWNQIELSEHAPGWLTPYHGQSFYFVHSYCVRPSDERLVAAETHYEKAAFPTVVTNGPLVGVQFHPELSGEAGENLMDDILRQMT